MFVLKGTTEKIRATLSAARTVDVHASYNDLISGVQTAGSQETALTTTTVTDIVNVGANASDRRNVKFINIRNKDTNPVDVLVTKDVSGTVTELVKMTLRAGEVLQWTEFFGWFVVSNPNKLDVKLRVAADVTFATTSFADITGLTYPVESGKQYAFEAYVFHIENASTTGFRLGINGPSMTAMRINGFTVFAGSITAATFAAATADVAALDTSVLGVTTSSAATPQVAIAHMSGWFNPSAAGTFAVRAQSEVAVAAGVTVKQGSWCRLFETDN